jgi:hypothetical protein
VRGRGCPVRQPAHQFQRQQKLTASARAFFAPHTCLLLLSANTYCETEEKDVRSDKSDVDSNNYGFIINHMRSVSRVTNTLQDTKH